MGGLCTKGLVYSRPCPDLPSVFACLPFSLEGSEQDKSRWFGDYEQCYLQGMDHTSAGEGNINKSHLLFVYVGLRAIDIPTLTLLDNKTLLSFSHHDKGHCPSTN